MNEDPSPLYSLTGSAQETAGSCDRTFRLLIRRSPLRRHHDEAVHTDKRHRPVADQRQSMAMRASLTGDPSSRPPEPWRHHSCRHSQRQDDNAPEARRNSTRHLPIGISARHASGAARCWNGRSRPDQRQTQSVREQNTTLKPRGGINGSTSGSIGWASATSGCSRSLVRTAARSLGRHMQNVGPARCWDHRRAGRD